MKFDAVSVKKTATTSWSFRKRMPAGAMSVEIPNLFISEIEPINLLIDHFTRIDKQAEGFLKFSDSQTLIPEQRRIIIGAFAKLTSHPDLNTIARDYEQIFTFYDDVVAEYLLKNMPSVAIRFFFDYFNTLRFALSQQAIENESDLVVPAHILDFITPHSTLSRFLSDCPELAVALLTDPIFIGEVFLWSNILRQIEHVGIPPIQIYIYLLSQNIDQAEVQNLLRNDAMLAAKIIECLKDIPADLLAEVTEPLSPLFAFLSELDTAENTPEDNSKDAGYFRPRF